MTLAKPRMALAPHPCPDEREQAIADPQQAIARRQITRGHGPVRVDRERRHRRRQRSDELTDQLGPDRLLLQPHGPVDETTEASGPGCLNEVRAHGLRFSASRPPGVNPRTTRTPRSKNNEAREGREGQDAAKAPGVALASLALALVGRARRRVAG
jgi:hypothetical protein